MLLNRFLLIIINYFHVLKRMCLYLDPQEENILYFLEFFPRVLLISGCANMQVQFKGGKETRAGTINIATLLCSYVHGDYSRAEFISFSSSQVTGAGTIQGREEFKEIRYLHCKVMGTYIKFRMCSKRPFPEWQSTEPDSS